MNSNQFSEHGFVIRERRPFEVADLAFIILRKAWRPLLFYFCFLFIPCFVFTQTIFSCIFWRLWNESILHDSFPNYFGYIIVLFLFIGYESSFVTSLMTIWLGEWFFHPEKKIYYKKIFGTWGHLLPQIWYYQVLFRFYSVFRKYTSEILLLEQTPFFSEKGSINTAKRIRMFQKAGGSTGTEMYSYINFFCCVYLIGGFCLFLPWFLPSLNYSNIGPNACFTLHLYFLWFYPLYCWSFIFYLAVYNFLGYLHVRIGREGWDLEIAFKAEYFRNEEKTDGFIPLSATELYAEKEDMISLTRLDLQENDKQTISTSKEESR